VTVPEALESNYFDSQGFDPDHASRVRSHYLQWVEGRRLLVELGCGRGEFLTAARGRVARLVGVDSDPEMVRQAAEAGFEAIQADVIDFLDATADRPDAVFLAHLIEHLPVADAFTMLSSIARVTEPGGVLIVVTPNPACLANLTNDFWSDPTHVRLYTLDLLAFLLEQNGFDVVDRGGNPLDVPGPPPRLLSPEPLEAWGQADPTIEPRALVEYDQSLHLETVLDEMARLRVAVESLIHWVGEHDERLDSLRHLTETVAERHDDTLRHLYGPNEIYVVGERRA
jgi:SAM-dependent methyltransferase